MNSTFRTVLCATMVGTTALPDVCSAIPLPRAAGGKPGRDDFVAAWGVRQQDYGRNFADDGIVAVEQISSSAPANMAYAGDPVVLGIQFRNLTAQPLALRGRWVVVDYGLRTRSADVFDLGLVKYDERKSTSFDLALPASGTVRLQVTPEIIGKFGSSVLLFEREDNGTRLFVSALARMMDADLAPGQPTYQICMDLSESEAITRLHTAPNRIGVQYYASDEKGSEKYYAQIAEQLETIHTSGFPVCVEFGAGSSVGQTQPMGRTRPHLTDDGILLETKCDYAWLPKYDPDFKQRVKWLVRKYGYPKGPVNAIKLWNEPWEGLSIAGWGADSLRYRELYTAMCEGVEEAMSEDPEIHVLLGGCDSSSNTFDKLFPDGDMKFLKWLDFMSLHYQGLSPSNPRFLRERKSQNGRTRFWDTESWVANSEDRVPGVLAGMLAAGHDRLVGIQGNAVVAAPYSVNAVLDNGTTEARKQFAAWPVAPALAAFQHFVGNRVFEKLLWEGLPWVYVFKGEGDDDVTLIVCGDIASVFDGAGRIGIVPFRTCRPVDEILDGKMTFRTDGSIKMFDGCGNEVAAQNGILTLPLNATSVYLRSDGTRGSGANLLKTVAGARIDGYSPVAPVLRDATKAIDNGAVFTAELRNVLNREINGRLFVTAEGLELAYDAEVTIAPHQVVSVPLTVRGGMPAVGNAYAFKLRFDAGDDGVATLNETLHGNVIARRTINVDGLLTDWDGVLAQSVVGGGDGATLMERAWLPMVKYEEGAGNGFAVAWMAADDENFYFAAKIADATPHEGMPRFETRDEAADFYPAEVEEYDKEATFALRPDATTKLNGVSESGKVWSPLVEKIAFTASLPQGGVRLAIRLADDDDLMRRMMGVTVTDSAGKTLVRHELRPVAEHAWARMNVPSSGPVTVEIRTRNWLKPQIAAVAFDPLEDGLQNLRVEVDSGKGFAERYGSLGMVTPDNGRTDFDFAWKADILFTKMRWPEDVRRYSYRRRPVLPQGNGFDNVQIAFNVLPDDKKPWYPFALGTFKGYAGYWDTDYEFALNTVAERYGGGVEVWKLRAPNLPDKHYYPRSPKHPEEGPAKDAKLVVRHEGGTRIVEAAIPWAHIPEVKAARDMGKPVKFSYRVNDDGASGFCMELARMRSVSKRNESFKPGWVEHWANELEFGWE